MKILNELEYAENLLKKGFTKKISMGELVILAKYFRYKGKNDEEIENELIRFCERHEPGFIYDLYAYLIEKAIKSSSKFTLRIPVDIPITENELNTIRGIKNYRYEKVLFAMLVLGKYYKLTNTGSQSKSKYYFITGYNAPIFRFAHTSEKKNERIMHYLYKNGYIDNNVKYNSYVLLFTNAEDNSNIVFYVTDINDVIKFYPPRCDICGKDLDKKSNRQNTCEDCGKEIRKQQVKNNVKSYRIAKM